MSRLGQVDLDTAPALSRPMLEGVQRKRGFLPQMYRALGNSPAAMSAYAAFGGAMAGSTLPVAVKEQVSIAVATSSAAGRADVHGYRVVPVGNRWQWGLTDRAGNVRPSYPPADASTAYGYLERSPLVTLAREADDLRGTILSAPPTVPRARLTWE